MPSRARLTAVGGALVLSILVVAIFKTRVAGETQIRRGGARFGDFVELRDLEDPSGELLDPVEAFSVRELRDAIDTAPKGEWREVNLHGGMDPLEVEEPLTLQPGKMIRVQAVTPGLQLNGRHSSQLFHVARGAALDLGNVELFGGDAEFGGAVQNEGGYLHVHNCSLLNNTAAVGGAVFSQGGEVSLINVTFRGNAAEEAGGGLYVQRRARASLSGVDFDGNYAPEGSDMMLDLHDPLFGRLPMFDVPRAVLVWGLLSVWLCVVVGGRVVSRLLTERKGCPGGRHAHPITVAHALNDADVENPPSAVDDAVAAAARVDHGLAILIDTERATRGQSALSNPDVEVMGHEEVMKHRQLQHLPPPPHAVPVPPAAPQPPLYSLDTHLRLTALVARGGHSDVYRAVWTGFAGGDLDKAAGARRRCSRVVAVKRLVSRDPPAGKLPNPVTSGRALRRGPTAADAGAQRLLGRWRNESEIAFQLRHPNIVRVYGVLCETTHFQGLAFGVGMVMQWLPLSLNDALAAGAFPPTPRAVRRRALPVPRDTLSLSDGEGEGEGEDGTVASPGVLRLALDAARGLAHLHSRAIPVVHRDLKASNVMLTADFSTALLSDFGEAMRLDGDGPSSEHDPDEHDELPAARPPVGTLLYAAPEALRGEAAGTALDVWSLGMIIAELISSQPLLELWEMHQLDKQQRQHGAVHPTVGVAARPSSTASCGWTPSARALDVSDASLTSLLQACWALDPQQRPHAAHVVKTLEALQHRARGVTPPSPPSHSSSAASSVGSTSTEEPPEEVGPVDAAHVVAGPIAPRSSDARVVVRQQPRAVDPPYASSEVLCARRGAASHAAGAGSGTGLQTRAHSPPLPPPSPEPLPLSAAASPAAPAVQSPPTPTTPTTPTTSVPCPSLVPSAGPSSEPSQRDRRATEFRNAWGDWFDAGPSPARASSPPHGTVWTVGVVHRDSP